MYDKKIEVFGLDGNYWALGLVLSDNDEEYVKEIDLEVLNSYKEKVKPLIKTLKEIDNDLLAGAAKFLRPPPACSIRFGRMFAGGHGA